MFNPSWLYVGLIYATCVWVARRATIDLPVRIAAFFYALVFVFMYLPLTQDTVNLPVDFLRTLPPWVYTTADRVAANSQTNDIPLQIVPWAHQVRESWRALEPPLWNEFSGTGYPLLASAQSSALSPLRILGLPLSLAHAMTFEAAMKILLALTFMFLWCRRRGYSELASAAGAVAFGFSSFLLVWLHFPIVTTACFVPAVFYVIDLLAERRTYPRLVAGAAVWAVMLFGGHPETASHTFFLATLYVLWLVIVERVVRWNIFLTLGGALAIAALLAAPLLAPFAEAVTKSKRYQELARKPAGAIEVPFSDWPSAKLLINPRFYGDVTRQTWGPAHAEAITGFAGTLGLAAWFALLAHVVRARAWRSREMFFVTATVVVLGVIVSWPVVSELFHLVFRLAANARLRLMLGLLLSIQTAALIDLIRRDRRAVQIGLAAAAALLLFVLSTTYFALPAHRTGAVTAMLPGAALLLLASAATLVRRNLPLMLLLLTGITGELWALGRDWNPLVPAQWMYPKTPMLQALDDLKAKIPANQPFRIAGERAVLFPNTSALFGYEDVRAHDPMANARYINFLTLTTGYDASNYFAEWTEWDNPVLDFLNVRYILATPGAEMPRFRLVYDGPDGRIFENPAVLPRFFAARNVLLEFRDDYFDAELRKLHEWEHTVFLDKLELEAEQQRGDFFNGRPWDAPLAVTTIKEASGREYRLHVKAPRYSLVASSVPWWPGWKVERNGARIEPIRVHNAFLGFAVPPGESEVRVWYDPASFRYGAIASLATIAALVAYGVWLRK
ncbi:MAG TPA: YfhO family protein [Thermoanaerobaculia bacterium]